MRRGRLSVVGAPAAIWNYGPALEKPERMRINESTFAIRHESMEHRDWVSRGALCEVLESL